VFTNTPMVKKAREGVMEFLLINHPLDCPICDQGGECQLQDLAVGYGGSSSRYEEEKRVVFHKDVGPLISMEEMSRCIHCTRCVRFGQEVSGEMELGMIHRGEHSEITTVKGETVDSELSGNMIDLCPVGALTSKPFRYSARTWELSRRKSVSPHDSTGSNLIVQVKANNVLRVLPLENEDVNECWIADRDRFSYEALSSDERLTTPMLKQGGEWKSVDWTTALEYIARGLTQIKADHGAASIGAIGSAHATVEELHLLAKLVRGLGSENVDHRARHSDFAAAPAGQARWLGTSIAALSSLDAALVVGSFLRKDHPLFAQRLRQAARKGAQVHTLSALTDDWALSTGIRVVAAPSAWLASLASVAAAVAEAKGVSAPLAAVVTDEARTIAQSLINGEHKAVLLGNTAVQHPQANDLLAVAQWIGAQTSASVGSFGEAANSVGAQLVNAIPGAGGLNAGDMLGGKSGVIKAMLLLGTDPALDAANPAAAVAALQTAEMVVALTPFKTTALDCADVLLPVSPFTETSGTFVNAEGRVQSFHGVVKPLGDTRPAWKVLRVLGNLLNIAGFDFETSDDVKAQALGDLSHVASRLNNAAQLGASGQSLASGLQRVSDVSIYAADALVRRAPSLQRTADGQAARVSLPAALWAQLGLADADADGAKVRITQGQGSAVLSARLDATLAADVVRVAAGHADTATLGALFGAIQVEKA
jgi:NADH-quinone oxidoreductase subunit G